MVPLWVFIVVIVVCVGILLWEIIGNRVILKNIEEEWREEYGNIARILLYYHWKFGNVPQEQIEADQEDFIKALENGTIR